MPLECSTNSIGVQILCCVYAVFASLTHLNSTGISRVC